ncbi:MAG: hypothetical protein JKY80_06880 [Mariprofundaceae bacterium]|nr:hypothetical protein [Mariprofundaceae bacterium]
MEKRINSKAVELADILEDYEHVNMTPLHVRTWLNQFPRNKQLIIISELVNVLGRTYVTKVALHGFLKKLIHNEALTQGAPQAFWENATLLNIQNQGGSQSELIKEFQKVMLKELKQNISVNTEKHNLIYLDDFLFSGNRVKQDMLKWLSETNVDNITIHYVFIGWHTYGQFSSFKEIKSEAKRLGKTFKFKGWRTPFYNLENRKYYKNNSDVLWPVKWSDEPEVATYANALNNKFPVELRQENKNFSSRIFSSEESRQVLEDAFLVSGAKIISYCQNPKSILRPLGYSSFNGPGFGALVASYRNCPNNCPLALWWGDTETILNTNSPLSKWYPLLPRKTYG